ncbi:MAG: DUF992 domain-containing protein [Alphaproteobacteria bacterium]|nr:DUF992 domain-containing protein [Alphaproteobacteria bacterium]
MKLRLLPALAATLALATAACQQPTASQINQQNSSSRIYIGALSCNVSGSQGYVLTSSKQLDCVFIDKNGTSAAYSGTIHKYGVDIGYTNAQHTIWRVYSLGSEKSATALSGRYVGEDSTVAASSQAGGNWLYGGANREIAMIAAGVVKDAGYNFATGVAEMSLTLR